MKNTPDQSIKYPGNRAALDGNTAVIMCERESTDAAGAYPITPSTQMGEYWAEAAANGHLNISERPLIFIEPEGEHAAAAVTAGLSMTGLRATNFSSGQGIAYMHESLYAAVGKRLTYVLNIGARAMTKSTLNVHAGHDDYHCVDDTGFFQLFAATAQEAADLNILSHRIAELALTPGIIAQDGFLTTHLIESVMVPERELIAEFLGYPDDIIDTPTPAQKILYGDKRRRIPELWTVDNPMMAGLVENQDAYMQSVASQRPFFFDHIEALTDQSFAEYSRLTGREYKRVMSYRAEDAEYLILGMGSVIPSAEEVCDYLRETRGLKVGVVNMTMFRPFPGDLVGELLKGRKGVVVMERLDQPLASDLPLIREIRATLNKCIENGRVPDELPNQGLTPYTQLSDLPDLYSASFGLGSRDLQPEGLIGAVENMLPDGGKKKHFYLGIDFIRKKAYTPKQELYQETISEAYPNIAELAVRGSENPNLMPKNSVTVRFHSVGGWGMITTGKNMAMTLFDLLGYHIKANPKYGSEKKGQPTTYYLCASPDPIRINCEFFHVDVVLSPDPNVLKHTDALAGLKEGGTFIIQSDLGSPEAVWASIPQDFQKIIAEKNIRFFYLDAFQVARDEASDVELQLRMQGNVFQGAFFAASKVMAQAELDEERLMKAIKDQLNYKFGAKGARVVEDNLRVVRRGYDEVREITDKVVGKGHEGATETGELVLPAIVKKMPQSKSAISDIHRFWEQTGSFYAQGKGNDNITDPFIGLGIMPACTATFRDMTGIRFEYPLWNAEACTACGKCYTVCPDTAIPGLVNEVGEVLDTVVTRVKKAGHQVVQLPKAVRVLERELRSEFQQAKETDCVPEMIRAGVEKVLKDFSGDDDEKKVLKKEFGLFTEQLDDFPLALSRPFFTNMEKDQAGSGGLFSVTVNPQTCKGCMECVEVCDDGALKAVPQTAEAVDKLRNDWKFWEDLPNTPRKFIQVDNLEEGVGALETILLDKKNYGALTSGDGACMGCSEKTALHLFVATVEALMQPRVEKQTAKLKQLVSDMEQHIRLKLVDSVDVENTDALESVLGGTGKDQDLTLSGIASRMENMGESQPLDPAWFKRMNGLVAKLKHLQWCYTEGVTGTGRSSMGILNSTGCTSVWGGTFPYNPYPFPWSNHLFQDSTSLAMGVFEGHMQKMADGFKAIRQAELELANEFNAKEHNEYFKYFTWKNFTDEEFHLCPPVVAVGGDGAMYDIGFQNLSRVMMSGKPIKIVVVDTQVYSNTGGQSCTSGFVGQISDMAQYGKVQKGKEEKRKEMGLIVMAHRTTYVTQSTTAHPSHLIEGYIQGLQSKRPALWNVYTSCMPEHGIADDAGAAQAKLAVESRAYPLFRFNPDLGKTPEECFDLSGNPKIHEAWPSYSLNYTEGGRAKKMDVPMTFADFAMTEGRFRKHFRMAPPDTWHDDMVPLAEFLELSEEDREGKFPFIWTVDKKDQLSRLLVDSTMVASCEERQDFWIMLKAIAGVKKPSAAEAGDDAEERIRREVIGQITAGLMNLSGGASAPMDGAPTGETADAPATTDSHGTGYSAPWIETDECTACDECIYINDEIFDYNEDGQVFIQNPDGGPYEDLVKAAEKCTARVIHPGLPRNADDPSMAKLIQRGEKYNS
jgi:pyruvate-ferredoxin/flavodoxin oxidoreductase